MARRINSYQIFRQIHFYAAACTGVFLVLLFVTGFLIARYNWFDHETADAQVEIVEAKLPDYGSDQELGRWVKQHLQLIGKVDWINRMSDSLVMIEIINPRAIHEVEVNLAMGTLKLSKRSQNTFETLSVLHRVHGYGGGFWYDIYLIGMDVASLGLLIFSLSGVVLWMKLLKRKWLGWVCLGLGLGYTLWVIITFLN